MRHYQLIATMLWLISLSGCTAEKQKVNAWTPTDTEAVEIQQLKARVSALEKAPQHHYELTQSGFRTFRFDPATGESCIQLTSTADWKKPETIRQGCPYQDFVNKPDATQEDRVSFYNVAECLYLSRCKPDQHVKLDMSTARPIKAPVKLDMSTARPIDPPSSH